MIQARVLYNDHEKYNLDSCVTREIGLSKDSAVEDYIEEHHLWEWTSIPGKEKRNKNKFFDRVPFHIMHPYGEKDSELCLSLGLKQKADLVRLDSAAETEGYKSLRPLMENEMKLTKVCFDMEREGVLIDQEYCEKAVERNRPV